jgi:hypothetical protein
MNQRRKGRLSRQPEGLFLRQIVPFGGAQEISVSAGECCNYMKNKEVMRMCRQELEIRCSIQLSYRRELLSP